MDHTAIERIIEQINQLSDDEQVELRLRLARQLDAEWERETELARQEADRRGITMDVIDRVIEQHRYGR